MIKYLGLLDQQTNSERMKRETMNLGLLTTQCAAGPEERNLHFSIKFAYYLVVGAGRRIDI